MADMPPEGSAPTEGGGSAGDAIVQADKILSALAQGLAESQSAPPGAAEAMQAVVDQFRGVVEGLMGGGEAAPAAPKAAPAGVGGAATAEQGGNPNARPMSMGG